MSDPFRQKDSGIYFLEDDDVREGRLRGDLAHGFVTIVFYANWCGHCQRLKPVYLRAAKVCRFNDCPVTAAVDCSERGELPEEIAELVEQHVDGFPTIVQFHNGKFRRVYQGDRSFMSLSRFIAGAREY